MFFKRLTAALILAASAASAGNIAARNGWAVHETSKPYEQLIKDVKAAAKAELASRFVKAFSEVASGNIARDSTSLFTSDRSAGFASVTVAPNGPNRISRERTTSSKS